MPAKPIDTEYWMLDTGLTWYSVDVIHKRRATHRTNACISAPFSSNQGPASSDQDQILKNAPLAFSSTISSDQVPSGDATIFKNLIMDAS
jgi:hypothetical protein